jgi:hypothetical protein
MESVVSWRTTSAASAIDRTVKAAVGCSSGEKAFVALFQVSKATKVTMESLILTDRKL